LQRPHRIVVRPVVSQVFVGHYSEHNKDKREHRSSEYPHELEPRADLELIHKLKVATVAFDTVAVADGDYLEQTYEEEGARCCIVVEYLEDVHATVGDHRYAAQERDEHVDGREKLFGVLEVEVRLDEWVVLVDDGCGYRLGGYQLVLAK
jgi:hypothetical protein